mmetsp:Transcript_66545/g.177227  ORF Transcript_66545/g.177227 Transcript_66545/m.177227 type:complete len:223 (-) Transcript_66545:7-675(-)
MLRGPRGQQRRRALRGAVPRAAGGRPRGLASRAAQLQGRHGGAADGGAAPVLRLPHALRRQQHARGPELRRAHGGGADLWRPALERRLPGGPGGRDRLPPADGVRDAGGARRGDGEARAARPREERLPGGRAAPGRQAAGHEGRAHGGRRAACGLRAGRRTEPGRHGRRMSFSRHLGGEGAAFSSRRSRGSSPARGCGGRARSSRTRERASARAHVCAHVRA